MAWEWEQVQTGKSVVHVWAKLRVRVRRRQPATRREIADVCTDLSAATGAALSSAHSRPPDLPSRVYTCVSSLKSRGVSYCPILLRLCVWRV